MRRIQWNQLMTALVLVRIGQELGTDSRLSRAIYELFVAVASNWR
jgi:hypothetical protein